MTASAIPTADIHAYLAELEDSCAIRDISTPEVEAEHLATFVSSEMKTHGLGPRDFALLVRQWAADYAAVLEPAFEAASIPPRNEAGSVGAMMLQEFLTEEASQLVVKLLRLSSTRSPNSPDAMSWLFVMGETGALNEGQLTAVSACKLPFD